MSVTAWKTAGTVASFDHDSDGGLVWNNPTNAQGAADTTVATCVGMGADFATHDFLKCTNFGFSSSDVPVGNIISVVEVKITRKGATVSGSATAVDVILKLVIGGSIVGTNKADTSTSWPTTLTAATYGTDLWGNSIAQTDVVASTFGVALMAGALGLGTATGSVDSVEIRLTYSAPSTYRRRPDAANVM